MTHPSQHLAHQCVVAAVLTKAHRVPEIPKSGIGVPHVVRHPPSQLVELCHRCGQVATYVVAVPALTQHGEHVRGEVVGQRRASVTSTESVVQPAERLSHLSDDLHVRYAQRSRD
ncbi:MAG: hypothetical protein ACRDTH_11525 [Pseudonocardiaceae bacterium]